MTISNEVNDTKINHIDNIEFQNSSFDYILGIWCETVSLHSTVAYLAPSQRHFFQSFLEKSVLLFFGHLLLEEGL